MSTQTLYPIMDESGKVREWFAAGRGVRVWTSQDIGAGRPDMLTPADCTDAPHWAYPLHASIVYKASEVTFFERSHVVADWSDSPAGWKAAARMIGSGLESERTVPIGKVLTNYTVERITFHSEQTVPGGFGGAKDTRPLCTRDRVAVVAWTAIVKNGDENA
jgi:hypothetical protein